jgi:hypothetical protein
MGNAAYSVFGFVTFGRFGTNVGSKILVTLGFVFRYHFMKRLASERAGRFKHPIAFGASKALKLLVLNLY